ncbi:peptidase M75 [Streptomyces sp. CBMA29]|nr:peptidase M75 [Streptomyces sp. CBMA29]
MPSVARRTLSLVPLAVVALVATGCSSNDKAASAGSSSGGKNGGKNGAVTIKAGDKSCEVATGSLPAGRHTFSVANTASQVTEVYVYAPGDRIMGEVENIGPSTKRDLIIDLPAGEYEVACKPGMVGDGIRSTLKVTGSRATPATVDQRLRTAVASYRAYVESETAALVDTTAAFTAAVTAGDLAKAQAAYPTARLHYERIEPIAESFGDLDPLIDMRADDITEGTPFTGFHALEQMLFQKKALGADASALADGLDVNTAKLAGLVKTVRITPLTMGNGAKSLLDEVAKSKVTGEEERYSRIDLLDFAGNVDGAKYVYSALRPALQERDPALVTALDQRFPALVGLLDTHRAQRGDRGYVPGSPYVSYDALSRDEVKALAVEVDTISEPLGRISSVVTSK